MKGVFKMVSRTVTVINEEGLHMRPAGALAKCAMSYENCEITLVYNGRRTDAKSVMQIMLAGINCGAQPTIEVSGPDEQRVLDELAEQFAKGFD